LQFRPDGEEFVVGCTHHHGETWEGVLLLCSIDSDSLTQRRRIDTYTGVSGCAYVAASGTSMSIVSTHDDGGVHIWDPSGAHTSSLVGHTDAALCVAAGPDHQQVITGGTEGIMRLWNIEEPDAPITNFRGHSGGICAIAWGGIHLATGSSDGSVKLWDPRVQEAIHSIDIVGGNTEVAALSWSQSSNLLAIASECSHALVLDTRVLGQPYNYHQHTASVTSVAFSPHNDSVLASGSDDTKVCVSDRSSGSTFTGAKHRDTVTAIAWHPKLPLTALSVGWDCEINLWNIQLDEMTRKCNESV